MFKRFFRSLVSISCFTAKLGFFGFLLLLTFLISIDVICGLNQYLLLDMVASSAAKRAEIAVVKDSAYNFKTVKAEDEDHSSISKFIDEQLVRIGFDKRTIEVKVEPIKSPIVKIKLIKKYHGIFSLFADSKIEVSTTAVVGRDKRALKDQSI